ncbi:aminotransferase class I/II-fold pyridoxal phosphate-dependent enzyme [Streptomyces sp. TS71-3]|uniref:aminotransferase class I/II-fold pyridoxal phosphate-dependent enzyme n=1 Tax=Streptomyces sp. TS71-3 TaxID=2733862 RepID=UPI001BB4285F|nr:aminotransferase class I/II-fold pyridoxal phosphate-dependent enzyme [Streptomyces sp. TS71-3]
MSPGSASALRAVSGLTEQERLIAHASVVDLGPGYPRVTLPEWVVDTLTDAALIRAALTVDGPDRPGTARMAWEQRAVDAARTLLGIGSGPPGFVTFSGSTALDRAIKAATGEGGTLLTSNPSIDIAIAMALENRAVTVDYFPCQPFTPGVDTAELVARRTDRTRAVLITSPQNPTGQILTREALTAIIDFCVRHRLVLVADQTLCLFPERDGEPPERGGEPPQRGGRLPGRGGELAAQGGEPPQRGRERVPLLPDLAPDELDWIFVWDTGKTFGLNEDKLGFLFCSPSMSQRVGVLLNTVQFGVARRLLAQFTAILTDPRLAAYLAWLNALVHRNGQVLGAALADTGLHPRYPDGGSMMLVRIDESLAMTEQEVTGRLLTGHGVGVVGFNTFVHVPVLRNDPAHRFFRMALARDPGIADVAAERLRAAARALHSGPRGSARPA